MFTRLRALAHHLYPSLRASNMSTVHNTNVACCTIPPVHSDYTPKGNYKPYAGFNKVRSTLEQYTTRKPDTGAVQHAQVYVTGPETPGKVAIICVYDIFG